MEIHKKRNPQKNNRSEMTADIQIILNCMVHFVSLWAMMNWCTLGGGLNHSKQQDLHSLNYVDKTKKQLNNRHFKHFERRKWARESFNSDQL